MEILASTPHVLVSMLQPLSPAWTDAREREGGWSPKEIIAHLILNEQTNWLTRASIILSDAPEKRFTPIDMVSHLSYAQQHAIKKLLEEFALLRAQSIRQLHRYRLDDDLMNKTGNHPVLGTVTLQQVIATWVTHDLSHVSQIIRILAKQNQEHVGPFSQYLRILSA